MFHKDKSLFEAIRPSRNRFFIPLLAILILCIIVAVIALYYYLGNYNHAAQPGATGQPLGSQTASDPLGIKQESQSKDGGTLPNGNKSTGGTANGGTSTTPTSASPAPTSVQQSSGGHSSGGSSGNTNPTSPTPTPPPAYTPHPLFVGDFETGNFSQWPICQTIAYNSNCSGYSGNHYALTLQSIVKRQGNWAARFEVRNGDQPFCCGERSEVNGDTALTSNEGDDRWYQWSTQFAAGWPNQGWAAVAQWHDDADGPPTLSFNASTDDGFANGNWGVLIHKNSSPSNTITTYTPWQTSISTGTWHDIKIHVKWSTNDSIGFIELWHNGVRQTFSSAPCAGQTRCMTRTMTPGGGGSVYYKQGYYRDPNYTTTGVVYHDGFSMAASEADLNPL